MSAGWKAVMTEIGKRLLQIVMAVVAEEVVRRSFKAAYLDNEPVIYEKPRLMRTSITPPKEN